MSNSNVFNSLFQPISDLSPNIFARKCNELSDYHFIELGVLRVLSDNGSGREFSQMASLDGLTNVSTSHLFKSLNSKRRLKHLMQEENKIAKDANKFLSPYDIFSQFKELEGFDLFASDGTYIEWACHDEKFEKKDKKTTDERKEAHIGTKRSCQNFYSFNLRSQTVRHLTVAHIGGERQKEHDMHALKRLSHDELRYGAKKGRKVLYVYDKAGIDIHQWEKWKKQGGIYFLSREKENQLLDLVEHKPFDKLDPINSGIISDESVENILGVPCRRVTYRCSISGNTFVFLTNLPYSVRPGLIALLYKFRWSVEKVYDVFKNKLAETKAWATSETAKTMQAKFICLTYNLSLMMSKKIELEENLKYEYDIERKTKELKIKQAELDAKGELYPSTWELCLRVTQLPQKFYRWLRVFIRKNTSWCDAIAKLRVLYVSN